MACRFYLSYVEALSSTTLTLSDCKLIVRRCHVLSESTWFPRIQAPLDRFEVWLPTDDLVFVIAKFDVSHSTSGSESMVTVECLDE